MSEYSVQVFDAPPMHWVGDGFAVQTLFFYADHGRALDPFLMLDYGRPRDFTPAARPRGVGEHPHRGFETVTIVYQGEVAHRDSTGQGGVIGPGDVQWMTAGAGILHEEFHSEAFTRSGGTMQMAQLWVNLPARAKSTPPRYQAIVAAGIPQGDLPDGAGRVRVIAGELYGLRGPAETHSPLTVADLRLDAGAKATIAKPRGWCGALVVMTGAVRLADDGRLGEGQLAVLDPSAERCQVRADGAAVVLVLLGQPLGEPVVGYGPFVMNTRAEIVRAVEDFNAGRFGRMPD